MDILAKPLADGSIAVSFINLSDHEWKETVCISYDTIISFLGYKMKDKDCFAGAKEYRIRNLWSGEVTGSSETKLAVSSVPAYGNLTFRVTPVNA
ncbi:MAG: hypothetical protein J6X66_05660 [Lachnospiraceae bacterium]|nr:hypothetical protein [Lachnospiraceae bacterium]